MPQTEDYKALALEMTEAGPRFSEMALVNNDKYHKDVSVYVEVTRLDGGITEWLFQVSLEKETNTILEDAAPLVAFFGGDFEEETDVPASVMEEFQRVRPEAVKLLQ